MSKYAQILNNRVINMVVADESFVSSQPQLRFELVQPGVSVGRGYIWNEGDAEPTAPPTPPADLAEEKANAKVELSTRVREYQDQLISRVHPVEREFWIRNYDNISATVGNPQNSLPPAAAAAAVAAGLGEGEYATLVKERLDSAEGAILNAAGWRLRTEQEIDAATTVEEVRTLAAKEIGA